MTYLAVRVLTYLAYLAVYCDVLGAVRELQDICVRYIKQMSAHYDHLLPSLPFSLRQLLTDTDQQQYSLYYPYETIVDH